MYKWRLTGKEVKPGDKASIEITLDSGTEQTLVVWVADPLYITGKDQMKVYAEEDINHPSGISLYPQFSDLGIEKVADKPEYWPPQTGDVWKTEGGLHYYKMNTPYSTKGRIVMAETGSLDIPEKELLNFKPVLVFRIGGIK